MESEKGEGKEREGVGGRERREGKEGERRGDVKARVRERECNEESLLSQSIHVLHVHASALVYGESCKRHCITRTRFPLVISTITYSTLQLRVPDKPILAALMDSEQC